MPQPPFQWQTPTPIQPPDWLLDLIHQQAPDLPGQYAAQLLWQRGIHEPEHVIGFLDARRYQPASPFEFGQEMQWAVERLQQAHATQEIVGIWGDFDADGVTATAVLWDGLGQFFSPHRQLFYYIPNRLTESHGLSHQGLDLLHQKGCRLVVTCDTGSTNLSEIEYAHQLGMDVIITDHHTLPAERPPVRAIVNPRYLPADHPLASLSGVAVAYKLVEALYQVAPTAPEAPLEHLLDLVAIGLIADLVELKGDCRYLAQRGIDRLQQQLSPTHQTRPGIARLLELCKRSGDRPTDISFGLGPRINAVSRIQGDAHFCVELLTSRDTQRCRELAEMTELANARRKVLQKSVYQQAIAKVAQLDLSTTRVIVLVDDQWAAGVLGLVAGQIAQEYDRPTILLSTDNSNPDNSNPNPAVLDNSNSDNQNPEQAVTPALARGSARSIQQIDLYQLVKDQAHLLHRFGGHPFAAGLSLPVDNIPLFAEAINQRLQQLATSDATSVLPADLVVTVAELSKELFQELKLLEPCGMGNPVPRLFIRNCWFETVWHQSIKDWKGRKLQYIQTTFTLRDDSTAEGFPGIWWGHYKDEVPIGRCDAIVELDSNSYKRRYEVRLIAVRPSTETSHLAEPNPTDWIVDWRSSTPGDRASEPTRSDSTLLVMGHCPASWNELQAWFRRAMQEQKALAIAYSPPDPIVAEAVWQTLVGIAKYLSRTGKTATRSQLYNKLGIGDRPLQMGFQALAISGFSITYLDQAFQVSGQPGAATPAIESQRTEAIDQFCTAIQEEYFRRQYFCQVPLTTIQAVARQTLMMRT